MKFDDLDGRCFSTLTKETHSFQAPFDETFLGLMLETTSSLMSCGFKIDYGYTQSDEISLLLNLRDETFGRKERKLNSILAAEASARFSLTLGAMGCFDCRISQLPTKQDVVDYFRWRNEDACRNALNSHCYWMLRKKGYSVKKATGLLNGESVSKKNELLFENGINFNDLPNWQKRGVGLFWENYTKMSLNPKTDEMVPAKRRRLVTCEDLPMKDAYSSFVLDILEGKE